MGGFVQKRDVSLSRFGNVELRRLSSAMNLRPLSLQPYVPERSSPSRVRFAAPDGAPRTEAGRSKNFPTRRERGRNAKTKLSMYSRQVCWRTTEMVHGLSGAL